MDAQKWSGKKLKNSNSVGYITDALVTLEVAMDFQTKGVQCTVGLNR